MSLFGDGTLHWPDPDLEAATDAAMSDDGPCEKCGHFHPSTEPHRMVNEPCGDYRCCIN